jgi:hypothetical protein
MSPMSSMKKAASAALAALAVVAAAVLAGPALAHGTGLNTDGQAVYASAQIADGTGVTTTVAAAGTYVTVGTAAPLAAGEADGSGAITYTLASNKFTIATRQGVGEIELEACINDGVGTNSKTWTGAWHKVTSAAVTSQVGPIMRRTEAASALRESHGCVKTIVDAALLDTYDFRFDSQTNADTVVTRHAFFRVRKLFSK